MLMVKAAVHAKVQRTNVKCLNIPYRDHSLDLLHYAPLFSSGSVDHFVVRPTELWPLVYLENFLGPLFD